MLQVSVTNVGAALTIIGKDLEAGATFNADVALGTGKLRAGRIMNYTPATQTLAPSTDGSLPTAPVVMAGILADDFDDTGAATAQPGMVYKTGTFLRQEIESANNFAITPGSTIETNLRDIGIFLEQSYEAYVGLSPVPAGVTPLTDQTTVEELAEYEKATRKEERQEAAQQG